MYLYENLTALAGQKPPFRDGDPAKDAAFKPLGKQLLTIPT
jgi:hypothetical protein